MSTPANLAPYLQLVELAETQCALVQAGHVDELPRIQDEWTSLLRTLPPVPPGAAVDHLRRALSLVSQAELGIQAAMVQLQRELGQVGQHRALGHAYSPAAGVPPASSIDAAA